MHGPALKQKTQQRLCSFSDLSIGQCCDANIVVPLSKNNDIEFQIRMELLFASIGLVSDLVNE